MKRLWMLAALVVAFSGGFLMRGAWPGELAVHAQSAGRIFELRTYTAVDAEKLTALHARFKNHTLKLFEKHGMQNVGYWKPMDAPLSGTTMIYVIAHKSRDAAKASWAAFQNDPEWKKVATESEANGKILAKPPESVYLEAADYSPLK